MNTVLKAAMVLLGALGVSAVTLADPPSGPYAGSNEAGSKTATGSAATAIAAGVGTAAAIAAIVIGNNSNTSTSGTTTTK